MSQQDQPYGPYGTPDPAPSSYGPPQPGPQDAATDAVGNPYGTPAPYATTPYPLAPYAISPTGVTNQMAIFAIVFSSLGFITLITAVVGVVCGHIALGQLKADPRQQGRGLAIAGLVIGYVLIGFVVLGIALFAVAIGRLESTT